MNWVNLDGKETIICEEGELQSIVDSNISYRRTSVGKDYYRVVCPRCYLRNYYKGERNYTHRNLSIDKDFQVGHCFRCEGVFIDKLSGANNEVDKSLSIFDSRYNSHEFIADCINTSIYSDAIDIMHEPEARRYISNRNPAYNTHFNQFKLRYKNNKIIIPYYNIGDQDAPIYYQFRYIDVSKSPTGSKYFNPPIDNKPLYLTLDSCKKVVWKAKNPTILVEGAMTAIALKLVVGDSINVVALMGKYLTPYQSRYLKWLGVLGPLYVMMDETKLSEDTKKSCIDKGLSDCDIIPSSGLDAEDMLNDMGIDKFRELVETYLNSSENRTLTFSSIYDNIDTISDLNEGVKINWAI